MGIGPYNRPHKAPDFEGGQGRPPLQGVVGVDAHIDPQEMAGLLRFSGETVLVFYSTP